MGFKLVICPPNYQDHWPQRLREEIPDIDVHVCPTVGEAMEVIGDADAAFGDIVPELLERAHNLKWVACPQAGPRAGYYHQALINSEVVVTNTREIYNDHISAHIMSLLLAFARGLQVYVPQQVAGVWQQGYPTIYLPEATAVIVGVGGIGGETARLCSEFGMTVLGVDPRLPAPTPGVAELHRPDRLLEVPTQGRLRGGDRAGDAGNPGHVRPGAVPGHEEQRVLHQHRPGSHGNPGRPGGRAAGRRDCRRRPGRVSG